MRDRNAVVIGGHLPLLPLLPLACAQARFQPVHVDDVAAAFALGGPRAYTPAELVLLAGRYAGHERRVLARPDWAARLEAQLFEMLPGDPVISRDKLDSMKVDNVVSPQTQALTADALGIKLTSLEAAAPHYLATPRGLDDYREHAGR